MSTTVDTATEIRSFHIKIPEEQIDDLRRRIAATRWPTKELVADRSQGVQLATLQELARYWTSEYDWRTHSTWCCRRCLATASRASRPSSAGSPTATHAPGRS